MAARRVGAAAPAVHVVAPVLRPDRGRPRAGARPEAVVGHPARILLRRRRFSPRARRAAWAAFADDDSLAPPVDGIRRRPRPRRGPGCRRLGRRGCRPRAIHRGRRAVRLRLQPGAARGPPARRLLVRAFVGSVPRPDRVLRTDWKTVGRCGAGRGGRLWAFVRAARPEHTRAPRTAAGKLGQRDDCVPRRITCRR